MKVYIKQVGNTVFFKQFDAGFSLEETEEFEFGSFEEDILVTVGSTTHLYIDGVHLSDDMARDFESCCIDLGSEREAYEYAENLKEICAEVVKRYGTKVVNSQEDGIYIF